MGIEYKYYTVSPNRLKESMHVTCSAQWQPHRKLSVNVSSAEGALAPVLMKLIAGDTVVSDTKGCSDLKAWDSSNTGIPAQGSPFTTFLWFIYPLPH